MTLMWNASKISCVTGCGIQPLNFQVPGACLWSSNVPPPKRRCIPQKRKGPHIDLKLNFNHVGE